MLRHVARDHGNQRSRIEENYKVQKYGKILKITTQFQVVKNCKIYKKFEFSKILIKPPKIDAPCSNKNSTISEGSLVLLSRTLHDIVIGVKKLNNITKIFFSPHLRGKISNKNKRIVDKSRLEC